MTRGQEEEKCIQTEKTNRENLVRPKTRLVRPTPNIKHPVITSADCKKTSQLEKKVQTVQKEPQANNAQSKSVTANDSPDNNKNEDQVQSSRPNKCYVKGGKEKSEKNPFKHPQQVCVQFIVPKVCHSLTSSTSPSHQL